MCVQREWAGETVGPDVWETCRELIPAGSVFAFLAEHRERLQPPEMFAGMYASRNGRPSLPPQVLAATVVLQSPFGTSDVETVPELRCDPRWKAACGLGLYDTAFDPSLLTYFRRRLQRSSDPGRIFTRVKEVVAATGILRGKRRRALDSTVFDDAVATQDKVTQLISAVRRVIREVPGAADAAAAAYCTAHDYAAPGKSKIAWRDTYRRWQPPVERGIAWLTAKGNRRLRYLGTLKNDSWLHNSAAALNLRRLINLDLTRTGATWPLAPATS